MRYPEEVLLKGGCMNQIYFVNALTPKQLRARKKARKRKVIQQDVPIQVIKPNTPEFIAKVDNAIKAEVTGRRKIRELPEAGKQWIKNKFGVYEFFNAQPVSTWGYQPNVNKRRKALGLT